MDYQRTPFTLTTRTAESAAGVRVQGHETTPRSVPSRPHAGTARRAWVDGDVGDRHVAGPRAIRTSDHATGGPPLGGLFDDAEEVDATAGLADRHACIAPSPCKNSQDHVDNAHENTDRQGDEEADDEEADDEEADDEETGGAVTLTWAMVESMERQRLQQETKQQQQSPQSQTGGDAVGFRMLVMSDEEDLAVTWHYSSSEDDEGVSTRSPPKNDKQSPASTYYDVKSILSPTNASHAKASTSGSATSASVSRSAWSLYGTQVSMGSLRSLRRLSSQSLSYSVNVLASASPTTPQGHGHVAHNAAPYHVGHGHSPVVPDNRPTVVDDASLRYTEWPASLPTAIPAPGKAYLSTAAAAGVTAIAPRKEAQRAVEGLIPDTLSSLGASHPLKILLVDDNHVVQMTMVKTLSKLGYACDVANNGQEVMALITRPTLYDVILMDLHMPLMDGFETTRRIKKLLGSCAEKPVDQAPTIIAITASESPDESMTCLRLGMQHYLAKPIGIWELYDLLLKCEPVPKDTRPISPSDASTNADRSSSSGTSLRLGHGRNGSF